MDALLKGQALEVEAPRRGEIRTGTIARVTESDILVDVGAKSEGVIEARELERLSEEELAQLEVGQEVEVFVLRTDEGGGPLLLSISRAEEEGDWLNAERLFESQEVYEGEINGFNKGGLIVKFGRLRGFVPASQVSLSRRRRSQGETPEERWGEMVNEPIAVKVIEVDQRRNRLILSERAATREARDALKEKLIAELQPGEIRTGHVISLADFGVFVDIGGADGLVHISEMSWKRVSNPHDLVEVGDEVQVKILNVDPERNRISLSMRELEEDPWDMIQETLSEGQLTEGTVTKLTKFGAFASLEAIKDYEVEGLIHISELAEEHIEHPREVVREGQILTLRVLQVDTERRRIGLSLKQVDSAQFAEQDWEAAMEDMEETGLEEGGSMGEPETQDPEAGRAQEEGGSAVVETEADAAVEAERDDSIEAKDPGGGLAES